MSSHSSQIFQGQGTQNIARTRLENAACTKTMKNIRALKPDIGCADEITSIERLTAVRLRIARRHNQPPRINTQAIENNFYLLISCTKSTQQKQIYMQKTMKGLILDSGTYYPSISPLMSPNNKLLQANQNCLIKIPANNLAQAGCS